MSLEQISAMIEQRESQKVIPDEVMASRRSLPALNYRDLIVDTVEKNQVTLIRGETGCGKSTQV